MPNMPEWIGVVVAVAPILLGLIAAVMHLYARLAILEDHDKTLWSALIKRGVASVVWKGLGTLSDDDD